MSLTVSQVSDEQGLNKIFKLRYKVFCQEWGFEKPDDLESGIITDPYDKNAVHFAAKNESDKIAGAVMLILPSSEGYPIERYSGINMENYDLPRETIGEISRLVVHRSYRKRAEDKYIYGPDEERRSIGSYDFPQTQVQSMYFRRADNKYKYSHKSGMKRAGDAQVDRRRRHEVMISLYKAVYQESKHRGFTHWFSMMTKGIANLLNKFGFCFKAVGDPVDYHGIRTPYLAQIREMEMEMLDKYPKLYEEFANSI